MVVSDKYLELLRYLDEDPLMSYQEIADRTDVTWITAKRRYNELKEKNILHDPIANYNYEKLGLIRINITAFIPDYLSLRHVEEACSVHPYANYRSRLISRGFGIFMVFFIPDDETARLNLKEYIEILKEEGRISAYKLMENKFQGLNVYTDLKKMNENTGKWEFDWQEWFKKFEDFTPLKQEPQNGTKPIDFNEITEQHLIALNRITKDATIKQADLIRDKELLLSRTEAHRIYNYVMDNFIVDIENIYDRSHFGLSDLKLFQIHDIDYTTINKFYQFIEAEPPSYRISLQVIKGNMILMWAQMDQVSAQNLSLELFKRFSNVETYDLMIYQNNSFRWSFYKDNFNIHNKTWKVDRNWMIEEPLNKLKNIHG